MRFLDPLDHQKDLWVLYGADGLYWVGDFDGKRFKPLGPKQRLWHGNFYAAQTFTNLPNNRVVQIGWGQGITFPGASFNQQMSVPVELTLVSGSHGPKLRALPVVELKERIRTKMVMEGFSGQNGSYALSDGAQLLDIRWKVGPLETGLRLPGLTIRHDPKAGKLFVGKIALDSIKEGDLTLQIVLDRGSVEVFTQQGDQAVSLARDPKLGKGNLTFLTSKQKWKYPNFLLPSWRRAEPLDLGILDEPPSCLAAGWVNDGRGANGLARPKSRQRPSEERRFALPIPPPKDRP